MSIPATGGTGHRACVAHGPRGRPQEGAQMHRRTGYALLAAIGLMAAGGQAAHAAVPGTTPVQVKDATDLGAYSARSMSVTVALKPRSGLDSLLASVASGATSPISTAQFNQRFAPAATTVANVTAFATANNLS